MNKWIKYGLTILIISSSTFAVASEKKIEVLIADSESSDVASVDAMKLMGGSRLIIVKVCIDA